MEKKTVEKIKSILLEKRAEILGQSRASIQNELKLSPDDLSDENDLAATEMSQNLVFEMRNRERLVLKQIHAVLNRMERGDFGVCSDCDMKIHTKRLLAQPFTTQCISCKEEEEHRNRLYA
ncbi:MAG: conjugal transfer protein TraR [Bdellovibrionaceae bacterium]|nr:conjugal transfer protein TraR [Pseudobdellovibrionaceae bacterium]